MNDGTRLPTDILCDIFLLLCDQPIALHDLKSGSHFDEFPWAVGQVCKHWRLAFLSYPALWSTLSFKESALLHYAPSAGYIAEMNRRTTTYLKRSGQQPLILLVRIPGITFESFYTTIWGILLSYSDRWKSADLNINTKSVNGLIERREKMAIIESLAIVVYNIQGQKYSTAFKNAPCLTELNLGVRGLGDGIMEGWTFPWAQLTKLRIEIPHLSFTDSNELETFLLHLRNVEELHIIEYDIFHRPYVRRAGQPVRLPRLKQLGISLPIPWMLSCFETVRTAGQSERFEAWNAFSLRRIIAAIHVFYNRVNELTHPQCGFNIQDIIPHWI